MSLFSRWKNCKEQEYDAFPMDPEDDFKPKEASNRKRKSSDES